MKLALKSEDSFMKSCLLKPENPLTSFDSKNPMGKINR